MRLRRDPKALTFRPTKSARRNGRRSMRLSSPLATSPQRSNITIPDVLEFHRLTLRPARRMAAMAASAINAVKTRNDVPLNVGISISSGGGDSATLRGPWRLGWARLPSRWPVRG